MQPDKLVIRDARPADAGAAAELAADLVRFHHALDPDRFAILSDPIEPGYARFLASLTKRADAVVLVAEAGAEPAAIVGYAFGIVEGPSWPDLLDRHGRFHDMFVRPEYRGRGVGRRLAERMIQALCERGAPRIVLTTAWMNEPARRVFESLGFRPTMLELTRECATTARAGGAGA